MSRSYKKYSDKDDNIKSINLTLSSNKDILTDGPKYLLAKTKSIISKGALETQMASLFYQLGKIVYEEYEYDVNNSKEIKTCLKKIKKIRDNLSEK